MLKLSTPKLLLLQGVLLLGGMVFAWSRLLGQFQNFQELYGTLFRFRDCTLPNPILTACFYGSLAFVAAFIWSFTLVQHPTLVSQRRLRNFLLFGVVFAGSVVGYETADYFKWLPGPAVPVSCTPGINPLLTPCFYGLLFFLAAFLVSIVITRRLGASRDIL
ncbi:MAG: hypothetical protein A3J07_00660 [Candidatus Doudnabacteria bacterium RIFCSPLOWO2_02_FULL_49_13]|uniref:Vitamin K epoxide reductase domain-containing protein n=1 Tax=Candidatus Doudnabacteria bacterium RIFCSPHIGHO2_12_FULL_48_16 TaxID=1817838 RepID=A0A1F5PKD4_9BACT|nr:MAG: hypothetical protein A3B77_03575 [Candidatus Doudnabacteria bacterium RIFCSPHIGHO2_02_FULL_49_24]OGE88516.1 MAG: hypothetical protein A2760_00310 [Candidatus Doudnabacteria bacterium RIFCSPHIGHO2_01_FULL_50_67]OGE90264.1 MAG: hypothetical protein A3E29_04170 [Candidatus Doudnabacteria bacterium RIFCSPHIGHO2_12_FULL_48_16]OGE96920.1 MAG: hypothetical protein A2990_03960 [Candidatus Doudnabacteria bacterium RIFCSPLOWO2_01_FULL_49_40]OGF02320.1 MAG: hypothetical protein A3J07_00660 [Candid